MKSKKGSIIIDNNDLNNLINYYLNDYINNDFKKIEFELPHKIFTNKITYNEQKKQLEDFLLVFYVSSGSVEFEVVNKNNSFILKNLKIRLNNYKERENEAVLILQEIKDKELYDLNLTLIDYKDEDIIAKKNFSIKDNIKLKELENTINPKNRSNYLNDEFDNLFLEEEIIVDVHHKLKDRTIFYLFNYYYTYNENMYNNILILESEEFNIDNIVKNEFYDLSRISKKNLMNIKDILSNKDLENDKNMWDQRGIYFLKTLLKNENNYIRTNVLEMFIERNIKELTKDSDNLDYLNNLPSNRVYKNKKDLILKIGFSDHARNLYTHLGCFHEFNTNTKENTVKNIFKNDYRFKNYLENNK